MARRAAREQLDTDKSQVKQVLLQEWVGFDSTRHDRPFAVEINATTEEVPEEGLEPTLP